MLILRGVGEVAPQSDTFIIVKCVKWHNKNSVIQTSLSHLSLGHFGEKQPQAMGHVGGSKLITDLAGKDGLGPHGVAWRMGFPHVLSPLC